MNDAARRRITGVQEIRGPAMVAFPAGHGAQDGEVAGMACQPWPVLSNADARRGGADDTRRSLGFRARLWIERLELARPARHPQEDAGTLLPP